MDPYQTTLYEAFGIAELRPEPGSSACRVVLSPSFASDVAITAIVGAARRALEIRVLPAAGRRLVLERSGLVRRSVLVLGVGRARASVPDAPEEQDPRPRVIEVPMSEQEAAGLAGRMSAIDTSAVRVAPTVVLDGMVVRAELAVNGEHTAFEWHSPLRASGPRSFVLGLLDLAMARTPEPTMSDALAEARRCLR